MLPLTKSILVIEVLDKYFLISNAATKPVSWSVWTPPYSKRDIHRLTQKTDLSERPSRGFARQPRLHRTESFRTISVADSSSRKPPTFRCRWSGSRRWQTDRPCPRPPGRSTPENSQEAWKFRTASSWFRLNRFSNVDVFKNYGFLCKNIMDD